MNNSKLNDQLNYWVIWYRYSTEAQKSLDCSHHHNISFFTSRGSSPVNDARMSLEFVITEKKFLLFFLFGEKVN